MAWGASENQSAAEAVFDFGQSPATDRQLYKLWLLSGKKEDFRGRNLTRRDASKIIERLEQKRSDRPTRNPTHLNAYKGVYDRAVSAASAAGAKWLAENRDPVFSIFDPETGKRCPVFGRVGEVFIRFPDSKSPFGRWLKEHAFNKQHQYVYLPHAYFGRLEYGLQKACIKAALKELEAGGVRNLRLYDQDQWV